MNSRVVVSHFDGQRIKGLYRHPAGEDFKITIKLYEINLNYTITKHERSDLTIIENYKAEGFEISLDGILPISFLEEHIKIQGITTTTIVDASISSAIITAGQIEVLDTSTISDAWSMITLEKKHQFANIAKNHFKPWQSIKKKRLGCVVTYANTPNAWFPYFYKYYTNIFGENSIFVISPNTRDFVDYNLAGLISLSDFAYSDGARAQLMSGIGSGLNAYFENVIICDVDEILLPNPQRFKNFAEMLNSLPANEVTYGIGIDILQSPDEDTFDFNKKILDQRSQGILNTALSKPFIHRGSVNICAGSHFSDRPINLNYQSPVLFNLHLKFACMSIRNELAEINSHLCFDDEKIRDYSISSNKIENHPQYQKLDTNRPISFYSEVVLEFLRNYQEQSIQCRYSGHFLSKYESLKYIIDLNTIQSNHPIKLCD